MTDSRSVSHGSQQLRRFRIAIRDGATVDAAAELAGITITEARLHVAQDAKNPPPPEAYVLIGHNQGPNMAEATDDRLRLLIERAERLLEERKGISDDIKDVYLEAKATGFDPAIMKEMIKRRSMDRDKLAEREALIETYSIQLGLAF